MKMYLRPFLKIDVVAASGATMTFLYFSVTLATASVIGEEYGPITAVDLVLGDELLVEPDAGGRRRLVVVDDELDLAAEQAALGVERPCSQSW